MNLQVIAHSPYTLLPSGILIVEPHEGLRAARTMLLAAADYYVGVSVCADTDVPQRHRDRYEVAVAVLSESLGRSVLSATAQIVRQNWPYARILIFGRCLAPLEDNLYDARMDHMARPEELLAALVKLSEDPWNQRSIPARLPAGGTIRGLNAYKSLKDTIESDPTKRIANAVETSYRRDVPGDEQRFRQAS